MLTPTHTITLPLPRRLHPFERVIAELTISSLERNGTKSLADTLAQLERLKASVGSDLKDAAARAARAGSNEARVSCPQPSTLNPQP